MDRLLEGRTPFVGRGSELEQLRGLLEPRALVVVLGPGGMGKTRIAKEACRLEHVQSGVPVCFVSLEEAQTVEEAEHALALAAGFEPRCAGSALVEAVVARGRCVWILDNFEQLVDVAAGWVAELVHAAVESTWLVTSRRRLEVAGEVIWELPPLSLGGGESEALALFVARAREVRPQVDWAAEPDVVALVERLDGIPLALELAAAQLRLMQPAQILARLEKRPLKVLRGGPRTSADRHRTMRNAVEMCWQGLDGDARRALAVCSIFRGGFALDAAEGVLEGIHDDPFEVMGELRDRSLLRTWVAGDTVRLGFYETIRAFVAEHLQEDDAVSARGRHAALYASLPGLNEQGATPDSIATMALEQENLMQVLVWAEANTEDERLVGHGCRAALRLVELMTLRGPVSRALGVVRRALALPSAGLEASVMGRLLCARGWLCLMMGQMEEASGDLELALRAIEGSEADDDIRSQILSHQGTLARLEGRVQDAEVSYLGALKYRRACGDLAGEGRTLANLAGLCTEQGRLDEARGFFRQALEALEKSSDKRVEAVVVGNLGMLEQEDGQLAAAREHFERALVLHKALGHRRFVGIATCDLAGLACEEKCFLEALPLYESGLEQLRQAGDYRHEALMSFAMAACCARLRRQSQARQVLQRAEGLLEAVDEQAFRSAARLYRLIVVLLEAKPEDAPQARQEAERTIESVLALGSTDEVRLALRLVRAALDEVDEHEQSLKVGPGASWFQAPEGQVVALAHRPVLCRVLDALVSQRLERGETPMALEELVKRGWPGERLVAASGSNRVHVALSTLRRLGLQGLVVRQSGGYMISPQVPVVRSGASLDDVRGASS